MADTQQHDLVVWRLLDGKPGHENQTLGLCNALSRLVDIGRFDVPVRPGRLTQALQAVLGRFSEGGDLPAPDIILGAGHATHLPLIAAKKAYGGQTVVVMKPSLPLSWFNLAIVPEHDDVQGKHVFVTRGVMNAVVPVEHDDTGQVLMLLGGPSSHYGWDQHEVQDQVAAIVSADPDKHFVLSDSRRTPPETLEHLAQRGLPNLDLVSWQGTSPGWVAEQMGESDAVWVSEDSVSMVYEALTSGARVGLIEVPGLKTGRVSAGVRRLIADGWLTAFTQWQAEGVLKNPPETFNEAARCADWLLQKCQNGS